MTDDTSPAEWLARPVGELLDWKLWIACDPCRVTRPVQLRDLAVCLDDRLIAVVGRLRCATCRTRPYDVRLESPQRRGVGSYPQHDVLLLRGPRASTAS